MDGWKGFRRFGILGQKQQQSDMYRVVQAIEFERKRISGELHDSVGQDLYSVLVGVKIVSQLKVDESVKEPFLQIEQLTAKVLDEVKRMAHDLHPASLDELGLVSAIHTYLDRFEYIFGIRTKFNQSDTRRRYNKEIEIVLYRICQEVLTNAAKYSQTTELEINLVEDIHSVRLIVQDFGRGFQIEQYGQSNGGDGIGLISIRDRANSLGGDVKIRSILSKGTTIEVANPIHN